MALYHKHRIRQILPEHCSEFSQQRVSTRPKGFKFLLYHYAISLSMIPSRYSSITNSTVQIRHQIPLPARMGIHIRFIKKKQRSHCPDKVRWHLAGLSAVFHLHSDSQTSATVLPVFILHKLNVNIPNISECQRFVKELRQIPFITIYDPGEFITPAKPSLSNFNRPCQTLTVSAFHICCSRLILPDIQKKSSDLPICTD